MADTPLPKKSLGQHWLDDPGSLQAICDAAEVSAEDTILEIGPGLGSLTKLLVDQARQVIAVEFDHSLAVGLADRVGSDNLQVVEQDILSYDLGSLPPDYKIVANIPYYLTSHLIRIISEASNRPQIAALLVQKEVAERITASPGSMSVLSVTAQYYWDTRLGEIVTKDQFTPPPKVDSQIVTLRRREHARYPDIDRKMYFRVVKAGFSQRRKTLLNSLSAGLQLSKAEVISACDQGGIDPGRRAQTLSLDEWAKLCQALYP